MSIQDNDRASAITLTLIALLVFFTALWFLQVDNVANMNDRQNRVDYANRAAKTAINRVDANGELYRASAEEFLNEYRKLRGFQANVSLGVTGPLKDDTGRVDALGGSDRLATHVRNDPILHDPYVNPLSPYNPNEIRCRYVTVDGQKRIAPYIEIGIDYSRNVRGSIESDIRYTSEGLRPLQKVPTTAPKNDSRDYKVLNVTVVDSFMGTLFLPFDLSCQTMVYQTSAIVFGSNEDLTPERDRQDNQHTPTP